MATRYPPDWIDELRARADIVSIISEYVPLRQNGRSFKGLCPFHNEKTPSFHVDPEKGLYYCFGCKAGGSVIQFVMEAERMEFSEAVRYLADKLHVTPPDQADDAQAEQKRSLRERIYVLNRKAAHFFHETLYTLEGKGTLSYLHDRGLDDQIIRIFGLGASPAGWDTLTRRFISEGATVDELVKAGLTVDRDGKRFDMFRGRAMFPIINAHGAVLGFGGRAMGDVQPKYLNTSDTPAFNKRQNVYAQNLLRKARSLKRVLLVEGYMDVVSLVRGGVEGVVATLGTALTEEQAKLIKRYAPEVWVAYDGDAAGQTATARALDVFSALDITARVLVFPDGLDPDDFIRQRGKEAFDALTPLSAPQFRMRRAASNLDLSTEEGRTQYAIACSAIIKTVRQPVEVENLLKRLMVETGYSREVLIQQIGMSIPDKPTYNSPAKREKLPAAASHILPEHLRAERTLLSLMGIGLAPVDMVKPAEFTDEGNRQIAVWLMEGRRPAELVEGCEDVALREVMLEVFSAEPRLYEDEATQVIAECRERMRRGWVEVRIQTLTNDAANASGNDRKKILLEIADLLKEKERLRPGRKE